MYVLYVYGMEVVVRASLAEELLHVLEARGVLLLVDVAAVVGGPDGLG